MLHILSLEDDSHSHKKFDTLYKDGQSFHRLSNSILSIIAKMLHHAHPSDFITHVVRMNNAHNINFIMIQHA
jgi:hypothetical protein